MSSIVSPCIKICQMDSNGICIGCRRTRDEIGDWKKYTDEQKQEILDKTSFRTIVQQETGGFSF
jgi:predicted Fe-S protein YdhL (DUF1289 family)